MKKTLRQWMLMTMAVVCIGGLLTACEEKKEEEETPVTPVDPNNPDDDDDNQVFSKGGTVTNGDLTLTFPSGTYSEGWGTTVDVKKVSKGSVISGDEISDCYFVSFFGDTHKTITVQLPGEEADNVMLAVKSKGFIPSSGELTEVDMISMLPTTYSNGKYTAQLPAFEFGRDIEGDIGNMDIDSDVNLVIALVQTSDDGAAARQDSNASTRAARRTSYTLKWVPSSSKNEEQDRMIRTEMMPDVLDKLQLMGFEIKATDHIPIYMEKIEGKHAGAWGVFNMNPYSSEFDCVEINKTLFTGTLSDYDKNELKTTLLHECLHYLQGHGYNPNWTNYGTAREYAYGNSWWQILDECAAVWCEKFYTNTPDLTVKFAADAVRNFFPDDIWCSYHKEATTDGLEQHVPAGMAFDRCGDHGYGLSVFLRYITNIYGDTAPVKLFEARKNKASSARACFEQMGKKLGVNNILDYEVLRDFMETVCKGKLFDATQINFDYFATQQNNNAASLTGNKELERKMPAIGAEVHKYYLPVRYEGSMDKTLAITQKSDDIRTEVYLVTGNRWSEAEYLGATIDGDTVKFTQLNQLKAQGSSAKPEAYIYTISIPRNNRAATLSLNFQLVDADVIFRLSDDKLTFEAAGGTQQITVTTNQPKLTGSFSDKSWLSATISSDNVIKITAKENTTYEERNAILVVRARDANDKVVAEKTINIKQKGKVYVNYQGMFVDDFMSLDHNNELRLRSDGTFYKKFQGQAEVTGTYVLVDYNYYGNSWDCTIIDPEGKTVSFSKPDGKWYIIYEGVELFPSEFFM